MGSPGKFVIAIVVYGLRLDCKANRWIQPRPYPFLDLKDQMNPMIVIPAPTSWSISSSSIQPWDAA